MKGSHAGVEGKSQCSVINTKMQLTTTQPEMHTQSHISFSLTGEWELGNDRENGGERFGWFLITPLACLEDSYMII